MKMKRTCQRARTPHHPNQAERPVPSRHPASLCVLAASRHDFVPISPFCQRTHRWTHRCACECVSEGVCVCVRARVCVKSSRHPAAFRPPRPRHLLLLAVPSSARLPIALLRMPSSRHPPIVFSPDGRTITAWTRRASLLVLATATGGSTPWKARGPGVRWLPRSVLGTGLRKAIFMWCRAAVRLFGSAPR